VILGLKLICCFFVSVLFPMGLAALVEDFSNDV
jgi:hypothetical protein